MLQPLCSKRGFRGTNSFLGSRRSQPSLPTTAAPARLSLIQLLHEVKAQQLYKPGNNCSAGSEAGAPHRMNKRKKTNRGRNQGNRDRLVITGLLLGIHPPSLAASWLLVPVLPLPFPTLPLQQALELLSPTPFLLQQGKLLCSRAGDIWGGFPPLSFLGSGRWHDRTGWHLFKVSFKAEFSSSRREISFSLCLCLVSLAEVPAAAPLSDFPWLLLLLPIEIPHSKREREGTAPSPGNISCECSVPASSQSLPCHPARHQREQLQERDDFSARRHSRVTVPLSGATPEAASRRIKAPRLCQAKHVSSVVTSMPQGCSCQPPSAPCKKQI